MKETSTQVNALLWVSIPAGLGTGRVIPVVRPAFALSLISQRVLQVGRASELRSYVEERKEAYRRNGHFDLAESLVCVEVPADQILVDRMLMVPGACYDFYQGIVDLSNAMKEG